MNPNDGTRKPPASRSDTAAIVRLVTANVLYGTGLFFHAFLYNFYLEALGHSPAVMGHAAAALTAGGLLLLLPAGWLVDRLSPVPATILAAGVTAAGLALGAVVRSPIPLYAAAGVAGAGAAIWRVAIPPVLMRLTSPANRPRAFAWNVGLLVGSSGISISIAGAIPPWLEHIAGMDRLGSVRVALLLGAAVTVASLPLFLGLARGMRGERPEVVEAREVAIARDLLPVARTLLPLVGLVGFWMLGAALVTPFLNIYFTRVHGLALAQVGVIFGVGHLIWGVAVLGSGELARRFDVLRVLAFSLPIFAPAVWGMAVTHSVAVAAGLFLVQGLVGPVTNPLIDQWLLGRAPISRHGVVSSWRNVAADGAGILGASVGGTLLARDNFGSLLASSGAVGLVGAVLLIIVVRRGSRR